MSNADRVLSGAGSLAYKGALATGVGVGIWKATTLSDKAVDAVENVGNKIGEVVEGARDPENWPQVHFPSNMNPLDALEGMPSATEFGQGLGSGLTGATSALGDLTGNVTTLLYVGLGVFAVYEIWRFSSR